MMQQLAVVPVTELKLDRSLVHGIADDTGLHVIVESALEMARGLGLATVAEGIEDGATPVWCAVGVLKARHYLVDKLIDKLIDILIDYAECRCAVTSAPMCCYTELRWNKRML